MRNGTSPEDNNFCCNYWKDYYELKYCCDPSWKSRSFSWVAPDTFCSSQFLLPPGWWQEDSPLATTASMRSVLVFLFQLECFLWHWFLNLHCYITLTASNLELEKKARKKNRVEPRSMLIIYYARSTSTVVP